EVRQHRDAALLTDRALDLDPEVRKPCNRFDGHAERLRRDVLELQRADRIADGALQLVVDRRELGLELRADLAARGLGALQRLADPLLLPGRLLEIDRGERPRVLLHARDGLARFLDALADLLV